MAQQFRKNRGIDKWKSGRTDWSKVVLDDMIYKNRLEQVVKVFRKNVHRHKKKHQAPENGKKLIAFTAYHPVNGNGTKAHYVVETLSQ